MKKLCIIALALTGWCGVKAQGLVPRPIPCYEPKIYTPAYESETNPKIDFKSYNCVDIYGPVALDTPNTIHIGRTDVVAGKSIRFGPGTHIGPLSDPIAPALIPHYFHAYIGENDFDVAWFEPNDSPGIVGQYEKLELGVKLPAPLDSMVYNFVHRVTTGDKLNPFDPDSISVEAEFSYNGETYNAYSPEFTKKVFGFYYKEYERNITTGPHPIFQEADTSNTWITDTTSFPFRIRFAPPEIGQWSVKIKIETPFGNYECLPVTFECVGSDNPGYVKVSTSNVRYLQLGNETFIPLGPVLAHPTCWDCWNADGAGDEAFHYKPANSLIYPRYHDELEDLAGKGGNFFRMLLTPWALDIEWEELNNYSDRLNYAWEMDRILDKAKELDLRMNLNMQIHFSLEIPSAYDNYFWDWDADALNTYDPSNIAFPPPVHSDQAFWDNGNPYQRELGLSEVKDFLTDSTAKKIYKNKIRYMISRWGYSTNIAVWELFSEVDNVGAVIPKVAIPGKIYTPEEAHAYKPYWHDASFRSAIEEWQSDIAGYIKEDLEHTAQLISIDYTGGPSDEAGEGTNGGIWGAHLDDSSYADPNIDIMAYNLYKGQAPGRYGPLVSQVNTRCVLFNKPLMFSEIGTTTGSCDNHAEFLRDLWSSAFSGAVGPGFDYRGESHDVHNSWQYYTVLADFLEGNTFAISDWHPAHDIRNDDMAEVFALVKRSTDEEAWGVIVNRTYNFFTNGVYGSSCVNPDLISEDYDELENISPSTFQQLKLNSMDDGFYTVEFYDAITGILLDVQHPEVLPLFNDLFLNYPALCVDGCPDNNDDGHPDFFPLIAFKAYKGGSKSMKSPVYDTPRVPFPIALDFEAYPNPAGDNVTISLPVAAVGDGHLRMVNSNGQVVFENDNTMQTVNVDLRGLQSGIYLVILYSSEHVLTKKLIVQHEKD